MGFWNSKKEDKGEVSMVDTKIIDFGEVLDISFSAKLYSQLKDEVEKESIVSFVTTELTRIDASCLQVLASFMSYANENEIKVEWQEPGEIIKEAAHLTGLTNILKLN